MRVRVSEVIAMFFCGLIAIIFGCAILQSKVAGVFISGWERYASGIGSIVLGWMSIWGICRIFYAKNKKGG
jgi:hypothetical protein